MYEMLTLVPTMFRLMYIRRLTIKYQVYQRRLYISSVIGYQGLLVLSAVPCFNQAQLVSNVSKCIIQIRRGRVVFLISSLGHVESSAQYLSSTLALNAAKNSE